MNAPKPRYFFTNVRDIMFFRNPSYIKAYWCTTFWFRDRRGLYRQASIRSQESFRWRERSSKYL